MENLKELFTGSTEKNANIKVDVNSLKDSSRADTATSIGVQINNSPKRGVYIDVVDGQSLLNVSVPVKERNLSLKVSGVFDDQTKCLEILDYSFNHSDDVFPKHVVKIKVSGAKKIGEIMQNHIEELSVCVDNVEKKYGATSIEVSSGCLELKFQLKSEQSARAMVADQKQIKGMFEDFVKSCGQERDVSVKATYEIVEQGEQEAGAQRKDKTHSQSRTTGSDTGASSGRIITLEREVLLQTKDRTDSQSRPTGSDTGTTESSSDSGITGLEDQMHQSKRGLQSFLREMLHPYQARYITVSQSRTTGSDTGTTESSSDSGITAMEEVWYERTHSRSRTTWREPRSVRRMFKYSGFEDRPRDSNLSEETTDSEISELEDPVERLSIPSLPKQRSKDSGILELEVLAQRKDRTDSQSRTTVSDTGALSGRIITLDLEDEMDPVESFKRGVTLGHSPSTSKGTWKLPFEKITQFLSALRNSGGGKLRLQIPPPSVFDWDLFQESTLANCLERCLLHDELQAVVFEITVDEKKRTIVVDAKPSPKLITFKFNTKIKNVASFIDPTIGQMTALLQTRRNEIPPQLKGKDLDIRRGNSVYFKSAAGIKQPTDLSCIKTFLFEDKILHQCISAMSKNISGGSFFLGIDVQNRRTSDAPHRIGDLLLEQSKVLSNELKEVMDENILVFDLGSGQFKSPPPDLIQCGVYKMPPGEYVIEVAVKPFDGVVFHERHGPEAYKLDDKDKLVRLTLDQWISEMTT